MSGAKIVNGELDPADFNWLRAEAAAPSSTTRPFSVSSIVMDPDGSR